MRVHLIAELQGAHMDGHLLGHDPDDETSLFEGKGVCEQHDGTFLQTDIR